MHLVHPMDDRNDGGELSGGVAFVHGENNGYGDESVRATEGFVRELTMSLWMSKVGAG